jgi:PRA1 family protein 1
VPRLSGPHLLTPLYLQAKPWGELLDRNSLSRPATLAETTSRIRKNAEYYRTNYAILAAGTTALVMIANPWSLMVLGCLALVWFWAYIIKTTPVAIGGRELSEREKFLALSGGSLVVVFFLTSVGSTLFYALGLSMIVVGLHAAMRAPDDLFLDEVPQASGGGFMALLTGRPAQQAVAAGV